MWPDLATFSHFGNIFRVLGDYVRCWAKIWTCFGQHFMPLGKFPNGHRLTSNLAFWSHWLIDRGRISNVLQLRCSVWLLCWQDHHWRVRILSRCVSMDCIFDFGFVVSVVQNKSLCTYVGKCLWWQTFYFYGFQKEPWWDGRFGKIPLKALRKQVPSENNILASWI